MKKLSLVFVFAVVLWGAIAHSAIMREVLGSTNGHFSAVTSIPVSIGSGVQNHDLVFVAITRNVQTSLTPPSGYTAVAPQNFGSSQSLDVFYHVWVTGNSRLVTFTTASATGTWATSAYTGEDPTPTLATPASTPTASSTTATSPSITPQTSTDMLLMVYGAVKANAQAFLSPSEGSVAASDVTNDSSAIVDKLLASGSGTGSQTVTLATAAANAGLQISMAPLATPTATATATPTASATATVTATPTPSATPTPYPVVNNLGTAGAQVAVGACSGAATKVLNGRPSRSEWLVICAAAANCNVGTPQGTAASPAPSATVGFPFAAGAAVREFVLGSAVVTDRLDCCGVAGTTTCATWEE